MCFSKAKWKREVVQDHKFDFVCIEDFKTNNILIRIKYIFLYLIIIKTILVYIADLWTAGILLIFDRWSSTITPSIPLYISKWIYVGCIFMSFLLLAWDWKKARSIIASKDISYAFTSIITFRYYSLKSFAHYCFFCQINEQKKKADEIALFVFFTFKGWKNILFAEAPRQVINAITLHSIIRSKKNKNWIELDDYGSDIIERIAMALMAFILLVFVIKASKLVFAFILYIPLLLFHIRGNLKEYCCHKIDKRIEKLLKMNSHERRAKQRKIERAVAKGKLNNLKKKDKLQLNHPIRQPTLPVLDDDIYNNNNYYSMPNYNNNLPERIEPYDPRLNLSREAIRRAISPEPAYNSQYRRPSIPSSVISSVSSRANSPELVYNSNILYQQSHHGGVNNPTIPVRYAPQNERYNNNYYY
ncbi:hypothetical protein C1645_690373 [Glomus cerebriforme]|uniref:Uncharacterized protein n=1 Tax=Glomus cerebriforme TaxID=658196 RepID=A0A397T6N6_9GLOM|nr:hypothetical protein C1645_690373 [Glomus cerebriforme]